MLGGSAHGSWLKPAWLALVFGLIGCAVTPAADFATMMVEATFKLTNSTFNVTCFLVHREAPDSALYLVTAAHVLELAKEDTATVVLRERRPDGSYQRRDYTLATRREGKPLWLRHATEDVAILRLAEQPPVAVAALPLSTLADEARLATAGLHICSPVFMLSYPAGLEANEACFAVARPGIIASHPLLPVDRYRTYLASLTTFLGDSGGPLFVRDADGNPLVIGLVMGELRRDEGVTMEYEERMIHHRVGLAIVVHTQFIREVIEQAAKQAGNGPGQKRAR